MNTHTAIANWVTAQRITISEDELGFGFRLEIVESVKGLVTTNASITLSEQGVLSLLGEVAGDLGYKVIRKLEVV